MLLVPGIFPITGAQKSRYNQSIYVSSYYDTTCPMRVTRCKDDNNVSERRGIAVNFQYDAYVDPELVLANTCVFCGPSFKRSGSMMHMPASRDFSLDFCVSVEVSLM